MLIASYICIGLSVLSLIIVIRTMQSRERKKVLRYYGITKKK